MLFIEEEEKSYYLIPFVYFNGDAIYEKELTFKVVFEVEGKKQTIERKQAFSLPNMCFSEVFHIESKKLEKDPSISLLILDNENEIDLIEYDFKKIKDHVTCRKRIALDSFILLNKIEYVKNEKIYMRLVHDKDFPCKDLQVKNSLGNDVLKEFKIENIDENHSIIELDIKEYNGQNDFIINIFHLELNDKLIENSFLNVVQFINNNDRYLPKKWEIVNNETHRDRMIRFRLVDEIKIIVSMYYHYENLLNIKNYDFYEKVERSFIQRLTFIIEQLLFVSNYDTFKKNLEKLYYVYSLRKALDLGGKYQNEIKAYSYTCFDEHGKIKKIDVTEDEDYYTYLGHQKVISIYEDYLIGDISKKVKKIDKNYDQIIKNLKEKKKLVSSIKFDLYVEMNNWCNSSVAIIFEN